MEERADHRTSSLNALERKGFLGAKKPECESIGGRSVSTYE